MSDLSDARDAAEWRQIGVDVYMRELAEAKRQRAELAAKERREFAWAEEYMAKSRTLELKLEAAEQQIAMLTEALQTYGQHGDGCEAWPSFAGHFQAASHIGKCTCGFEATLAAVRGEPK